MAAVSVAALIVMVFIAKVLCVMVIVLPEVWPVMPFHADGLVETMTVALLGAPEGILPLTV